MMTLFGGAAHRRRQTDKYDVRRRSRKAVAAHRKIRKTAARHRIPFVFPGLAGELHPDGTNANKHRCSLHALPNGFRYSTTKTGMVGKVVGGVYQRAPGIFIPGRYLSGFQRKRLTLNGRNN